MVLAIIIAIAAFIVGYFVGRNNPSISVVNKLLATGKAVIDKTNQVISIVKK